MVILVTGGGGFIGSNIVLGLVKKGSEVRILDNFSTGNRRNIAEIEKNVEIIEGDITSLATVKDSMKDVDYVIHEAALPSVSRSISDPLASNETNVSGTLKLLLAARDLGVKRFVYASSSSVYGDSPKLPKREDMCPNPKSPYAVSKLTGEQYCRLLYEIYGLETVSLRYFNVFGPRQDPGSEYAAVIPKFIDRMLKGNKPMIYGDGKQSRDFTYVGNVVNATIGALKAKKAPGEVINVACGARITVNDLVQKINEILGISIKPEYMDPRAGDIKHSLADIAKAREILGYEPSQSFDKGLKKTIDWFQRFSIH